jgi:hypothetical protein
MHTEHISHVYTAVRSRRQKAHFLLWSVVALEIVQWIAWWSANMMPFRRKKLECKFYTCIGPGSVPSGADLFFQIFLGFRWSEHPKRQCDIFSESAYQEVFTSFIHENRSYSSVTINDLLSLLLIAGCCLLFISSFLPAVCFVLSAASCLLSTVCCLRIVRLSCCLRSIFSLWFLLSVLSTAV